MSLIEAGPYAGWTNEAVLIADLYAVWAGQPHPALPKKNAATPAVVRAHRERLLEQKRRLGGQQK
ncbi:hypothetical protein [Kribbella sp. CA-293567]|uniref:hypothetical protein n=1 Tax=Kribbella sp. CA-293567 TaxID=3002436 RepID=UPI0022DE828C|nr:hypothetical protein [Kribbella sp. CA-293567]WBQ03789.1 hypothetical protein OX958_27945 [Kribbella sp. CA-293567]